MVDKKVAALELNRKLRHEAFLEVAPFLFSGLEASFSFKQVISIAQHDYLLGPNSRKERKK